MADKLGIYIHIPFCRSKCDYCDFYSLAGRDDRMDQYQKALLSHIKETAPLAQDFPVDTIYIGGGTPSYYGAKRLKELLGVIRNLYKVEKDAEVTVECNPDSVDVKSLKILRKAGVNRLSMGMQSAIACELERIHRIHTPQQVNEAATAARKAGFTNLSLDLIYGLPGQTMDSWKATVEHALSLIPQHLSCYGLKVEEGTPLAARVAQGEVLPDDDQQADLYLWTVGRLERAGYPQYEISNFAKPGYEGRHNLIYWDCGDYLGLGPAAHSCMGGRRFYYPPDTAAFLNDAAAPVMDGSCGAEDYLILQLRLRKGLSLDAYKKLYGKKFSTAQLAFVQNCVRAGYASFDGRTLALTPAGLIVQNSILAQLL